VHRLDRLTSGLLVLAKSLEARRRLARQVERRQIHRAYLGICGGIPPQMRGCVDLPIRRDPRRPTRMQAVVSAAPRSGPHGTPHVSSSGYSNPRLDFRPRPARTHYAVLRRLGPVALLRLVLETGRTHQIRVHLQALGVPLLGDPLYGASSQPLQPLEREESRQQKGPPHAGLARPALHAACLELAHPITGERLRFLAPLPEDLRALLMGLGAAASLPASDRHGRQCREE
jgi:23S rRNA pseudouridine1911/1915/1917 synthase